MSAFALAPAAGTGPRPFNQVEQSAAFGRRAAHLAEVAVTVKTARTIRALCDFMDFTDCIVMMVQTRYR